MGCGTRKKESKGQPLCPLLGLRCAGPVCKWWASAERNDRGECVMFLAALRLLAADDERGDVWKAALRDVASGKGLVGQMIQTLVGTTLSRFTGVRSQSVADEPSDMSSKFEGLDEEE